MGLIKDIGKLAGSVAGAVIGVPISVVGEVVQSEFLQEIGNGVHKVSEHTGELLGNVVEGVAETAYGTVTSDKQMQSNGFGKVVDSSVTYVGGMAKGVTKIATNGVKTVGAIIDGDTDEAVRVGKELAKTVIVGTLAVGVADVISGLDIFDDADDGFLEADNDGLIENFNEHHVTPHFRTLADGREIWVDGDGNTSIDTFEGWIQSNPDYKA